jgi:hypothetical protein
LVCQAASSGAQQRVPITLRLAVHRKAEEARATVAVSRKSTRVQACRPRSHEEARHPPQCSPRSKASDHRRRREGRAPVVLQDLEGGRLGDGRLLVGLQEGVLEAGKLVEVILVLALVHHELQRIGVLHPEHGDVHGDRLDVDDDAVVKLLAPLVARAGTLQARAHRQPVRDVDVLERGDERRDGLGGEKAAEVGLLLLTAGAVHR